MRILYLLIVLPSLLLAFGNGQIEYFDQDLIPYSDSITQNTTSYETSDTVYKVITIRPQDPKATSVLAQNIFLSTYFWGGNNALYEVQIVDTTTDSLLFSKEFTKLLSPDLECGFTYPENVKYLSLCDTFSTADDYYNKGVELTVGKSYKIQFIAKNISERSYGYYEDTTGNIWCKISGRVSSNMDSSITFANDSTNKYEFDLYSYQFPTKLIAVGSDAAENILINSNYPNLTYSIEGNQDISINITDGTPQIFSIKALKEGESRVFLLNESDTVGYFYVSSTKERFIRCSYTYIAYPGEKDTTVDLYYWNAAKGEYETITDIRVQDNEKAIAAIKELYKPINIKLDIVNNGTIFYDWDFDGDSISYEADRKERWSPIDSNIIPNMNKVFSNFFVLREEKRVLSNKTGQSGGGTSRSGKTPIRGAMKAVRVNTLPDIGIGYTLAHELGHNLGLVHYSANNTMHYPTPNESLNIMKTGREQNKFYAFQWKTIDAMIDYYASLGEVYIDTANATPIIIGNKFNNSSIASRISNNKLYITVDKKGEYEISIFNVFGRKIFNTESQLIKGENTLPIDNISKGFYFITLNKKGTVERSVIKITN